MCFDPDFTGTFDLETLVVVVGSVTTRRASGEVTQFRAVTLAMPQRQDNTKEMSVIYLDEIANGCLENQHRSQNLVAGIDLENVKTRRSPGSSEPGSIEAGNASLHGSDDRQVTGFFRTRLH